MQSLNSCSPGSMTALLSDALGGIDGAGMFGARFDGVDAALTDGDGVFDGRYGRGVVGCAGGAAGGGIRAGAIGAGLAFGVGGGVGPVNGAGFEGGGPACGAFDGGGMGSSGV